MTRYAKLVGRKPEFSKSSVQEARQRTATAQHHGGDGDSDSGDSGFANATSDLAAAAEAARPSSPLAAASSHAAITDLPPPAAPAVLTSTAKALDESATPAQLLKSAKLVRLKMKKAKTPEKRRELQAKLHALEQLVHVKNGERGQQQQIQAKTTAASKPTRKERRPDAVPSTSASTAIITNPWKAMEAERRAKADARSTVRREKRAEERESTTRCYACREVGHAAKECPQATVALAQAANAQTGGAVNLSAGAGGGGGGAPLVCCYRCGSTEHSLAKCRRPTPTSGSELPFAHCFICQQRGHLASKCAQNPGRGIYPHGGTCMVCQSVDHLAKDCPVNEAQQSGGSTAASNAVIGWADVHADAHRGADEDDFHAVSRKRSRGEKPKSASSAAKRSKVVSF